MSCGLHLMKVKADGVQGTLTFYYPSGAAGQQERSILPQPEGMLRRYVRTKNCADAKRYIDSIALAERINLFWSIFAADRTGSVGTGLPIVIRDEEIETPWPRRFEDFELVSCADNWSVPDANLGLAFRTTWCASTPPPSALSTSPATRAPTCVPRTTRTPSSARPSR